ncbi:MAG: tetratricopeptide repeat protein [Myxococcota bacterium]
MSEVPHVERVLGPNGEYAWQELRSQVEWASGFWLAFVFSSSGAVTAELEQRSRRLLAPGGGELQVVRPRSPVELRALVDGDRIERELRPGSLLWIESLRSDSDGLHPRGWDDAWRWLLQRLNERRELLRDLGGGLVLALPRSFKARGREVAPDLWSIRSLSLDIDDEPEVGPGTLEPSTTMDSAQTNLVVPPGIVGPAAKHVSDALHEAEGGRWDQAIGLAHQAVCATEDGTVAQADALALLANIENQAERTPSAARHWSEAVAVLERIVGRDAGAESLLRRRLASWNGLLGRAWAACAKPVRALAAFEQSVRWSDPSGKQPDHELVLIRIRGLMHASRMKRTLGAIRDAEPLARRAVDDARALRSKTDEVRTVLAMALYELGGVIEFLGRWQAASDAYEESLSLLRELVEHEVAIAAIDLAMLLLCVARTAISLDALDRALDAAMEAVEITRAELRQGGTRRDLSALAVGLLARVALRRGDIEAVVSASAELDELVMKLRAEDLEPAERAFIGHALRELVEELDVVLDEDPPVVHARSRLDETSRRLLAGSA